MENFWVEALRSKDPLGSPHLASTRLFPPNEQPTEIPPENPEIEAVSFILVKQGIENHEKSPDDYF